MTQAQHTQGEWTVRKSQNADQGFRDTLYVSTCGQEQRTICEIDGLADDPDALGNARLIASAPKLLEALEYAEREIKAFYDAAANGTIKTEISIGQFARLDNIRSVISGAKS